MVSVDQSDPTAGAVDRPSPASWRSIVIVAMAAVLVIGVVAAFGGFRQRSDTRLEGAVGATYALNVADVTILRATAKLYDGTWAISVFATVRNTTDRPLRMSDLNEATAFSYYDPSGMLVSYDVTVGNPSMRVVADSDPTLTLPREMLPPGGRAVPVRFDLFVEGTLVSGDEYAPDAVYAQNMRPDDGLLVRLTPVQYQSTYVLGISNDKSWVIDRSGAGYHFWVVTVPIEIVEG